MNYIEKQAETSLETVLLVCIEQLHYRSSFNPAFYRDLSCFAEPDRLLSEYMQIFREKCIAYFLKGETEGDFISGQNYELMATILTEQLNDFETAYKEAMIIVIIYGVCTEGGCERLKRLIQWE